MVRKKSNRRSLCLSDEVVQKGREIAAAESRKSLSNQVEVLIIREHQRLGLEGKNHPRRERAASESRREKGTK